jgi:predicted PurR-regulated permease PerM
VILPDLLARYRVLRVLVTLATVVLAIYTAQLIWTSLVAFGDVILLFFLAWLIAFVLDPLVVYLHHRGMPRALAVSLVYVALAITLAGLIVLTVPIIGEEIRRLAGELTAAAAPDNLNQLAANAIVTLERMGIKPRDAERIVPQIWGQIPTYTSELTRNAVDAGASAIASVLSLLFDAFLVSIISFYIMLDGGRITAGVMRRLPPAWKPDAKRFQGYVSQMFGGFLRAQLTLSLIYGALTWIMLVLLGQANGLLVALVCGLLVILPFIGPFMAVAPPVALVLLQTSPADMPLKLGLLIVGLIIAQQITFQIIAPRVFSSHLGVSPLLLIAALLIGAKEGGVWGAFFAGPVVAVAYAMFEVFYERFRRSSSLFPDAPAEPESEDAGPGEDIGAQERAPAPMVVEAPAPARRDTHPAHPSGERAL